MVNNGWASPTNQWDKSQTIYRTTPLWWAMPTLRRWRYIGSVLLLLLLLFPASVSANPRHLEVSVDTTQVELGKALTLQVRGEGLSRDLNEISFTPWDTQFGVEVLQDQSDTGEQKSAQSMAVKLYPRRTGKIVLPPLAFDNLRTSPIEINIVAAIRGNTPMRVQSHVSATTAWEREQILIRLEVYSTDRFFSLEMDQQPLPGFDLIPISTQQRTEQRDGIEYTVQSIGWALFPFQSGKHTVALPPVRYVRGGFTERRFYLPLYRLEIKPLPPYIPPMMPVGRITVDSTVSPDAMLYTDTLAYWTVTVRGDNVAATGLPPVLRQIKSNADIQFLPAETERTNKPDNTGVHGEVRHRIAFTPGSNGRLVLPTLHVQYFDPQTGRLVSVNYPPPAQYSLSLLWRVVIVVLAALVLLVTGIVFMQRWRDYRLVQKQRQHAYTCIEQAQDARSLRNGLNLLACAEGWPDQSSLTAWRQHWEQRYETDPALESLLNCLSYYCYGHAADVAHSGDDELRELRAAILQALRKPRRLKKRRRVVRYVDSRRLELFAGFKKQWSNDPL